MYSVIQNFYLISWDTLSNLFKSVGYFEIAV